MSEVAVDPREQASIVMPNGVTMTGVGGDPDALREQFEQRHQERTGQSVEATVTELAPAAQETKPQTRGSRRFSELTGERDAAQARAAAAEARAKDLEEKLRLASTRQPEVTPKVEALNDPAPTRPMPDESEIGSKYQTLAAYIRDLAAWEYEQREVKLRADFDARLHAGIEADRASRTRSTTVTTAFDRGRAQHADFDAVLDSAKDVMWTPEQQEVWMNIPQFEEVMYALAKDRNQLTEIHKITNPVQLGIRLAQVMPRTEAVASLPASTPVAVRTSNAPAPPQPVGAGSRTAQPSLEQLARDGNYEAYKARREADRKRA